MGARCNASSGESTIAVRDVLTDKSARVVTTGNLTISINSGSLEVRGGGGGSVFGTYVYGTYRGTSKSKAELGAGGNLTITGANSVEIAGGSGAEVGDVETSSAAARVFTTVDADAEVWGNNITLTAGGGRH